MRPLKTLYPNKSVKFLTLFSLLILALQVPSFDAQSQTTEIRCPDPWQIVSAGTKVFFDLQIINNGSVHEDYFLNVTNLPTDWNAYFYAGTKKVKVIEADPGKTRRVILEVTVPEDAPPKDYPFTVHAMGKYSNDSRMLTVTVEEIFRRIELLTPFPSKTALTGDSLSYAVKVSNGGERPERVYLSFEAGTELVNWGMSFIVDGQTIDYMDLKTGESKWIACSVSPPYLVSPAKYNLTLVATTEDGEFKATLSLSATILAYYQVEISSSQPLNPKVATGEAVSIHVTVRNIGESPITSLKLNVTAPATLPDILVTPLDVASLDPMESVDFFIRITPPTETTPGDYILKIRAESNEIQTDWRTIVITVATSIPWFWITIFLAIIATAIVVIALQRLASRLKIRIRRAK